MSTNHRSGSVNVTWEPDVTFFIQGLASLGEKKIILFVILLLGYIIILGGNSMIIFVVQNEISLSVRVCCKVMPLNVNICSALI